jgi:hypothetical protein
MTMMMRIWIGSTVAAAITLSASAQTPTTKPAAAPAMVPPVVAVDAQATADLEKRAIDAFEAADYAKALPLLKDLSVQVRGQPEKVAPLLEKIRVCEKSLASDPAAAPIEGINAPRVPHPKPTPGQPYAVALQKLGNFNYDGEKGGNIPADVQALSGTTVKVSGYMIPIDQSERITKFVLVPSLFACCFGQPPALQHTAMVTTPPGKTVAYFAEQIDVTGKLTVQERKEDGFIQSIFELDATSIRPTPVP